MMLREKFPCEEDSVQENIIDIEAVKRIYWKIGDSYSRNIFENRLMYSLTGDYRYIGNILSSSETGKDIRKMLENFETIYIYGAGIRGKLLVDMFGNINWKGFIDSNKNGFYMNYPIYHIKKFEYQRGDTILISNAIDSGKIRCFLMENKRVPEKNIIVLNDYIKHVSDNIYLDPLYLRDIEMKNKIFFDLGCFDGKDTIRAIDYFAKDRIYVYAVEPDNCNYIKCVEQLRKYIDKVTLQKKGIGCKKEVGSFLEGGSGAKFSKNGDVLIEIDTIDNMAGSQDVGFIKMDIEGYEEAAIAGGAETIKRCSPILAVSIYHKRSDIWKIPLKILEINPEYQFYLGHYSFGWDDTVLYGIVHEHGKRVGSYEKTWHCSPDI